jgi:hypothetical protein
MELKITGKQGVFGQSFYSIPLERKILKGHPLRDTLVDLNVRLGRPFLNDLLLDDEYEQKLGDPSDRHLRKLSVLTEPGNKHRMITIADWFTQNTLLPIHNHFMGLLRSIREDCTYTANEGFLYLQNQFIKHGPRHTACFDLQNFTDQLPLSLQMVVLTSLMGEKIAHLWKRIIREPILYKKQMIHFGRGQPMGLLSSWAVASLTHHYLVR